MRGACYTRDCRRNYNLDFELLLRRGFAYVPMKELQRLLRCNTPGGCPLSFQEDRAGSGLPLSTLRDYPLARLRLRCAGCRWEKTTTPAQVIGGLEKAGTGGPATLHTDLAKTLTRPCAKCGKTAWTCDVLWPGPARPARRPRARSAPPICGGRGATASAIEGPRQGLVR